MSKKQELLFLESEKFGSLYYHNVYSFYDEPLIFTALNEYEQLYFCYSLGCDQTHDRWIIVPTSQGKVNKLEQKDIPIVQMIQSSSKAKVILAKIDLESSELTEEILLAKNLPFKMPIESIFIRENINYDGKRKHSHRIRIAKKSSVAIISETLNQVSELFGEFCRNFLNKHNISVSFYPKDAVVGSFVYRVKTETNDKAVFENEGYQLLSGISSRDNLVSILSEKQVDLRIVKKLFDLIASNDIEIQFIDESSTKTILELNPQYISSVMPEIDDKLNLYLDSTMVPQADNLDRVKLYLELLLDSKSVTSENLGVDPRQVKYYRDACIILSLIHDYSALTPLGSRIATSNDENEWVRLIQRQFEESECGDFWMRKQNVDSLLQINEESAADFLIENCNGLSETTSRRRAQTFKSWVRRFKQLS
ncbi:DUF6575 domain-containing protein [Enterobacter asburiae]|uniref:DUF6575 domain-containing protein n=1 Tax=Enterobacter asburiae TaxID=61645 RepID=UPI000F8440F9|nr:DUF6575 domain-containing protein [Enterobacter asburiae]RTN76006.1 hypothetical protein EKN81_20860 [Enterobacter asburiae]RTP74320.1 hypothetical protein EKN32_20860 [Enterobacter asburiae]